VQRWREPRDRTPLFLFLLGLVGLGVIISVVGARLGTATKESPVDEQQVLVDDQIPVVTRRTWRYRTCMRAILIMFLAAAAGCTAGHDLGVRCESSINPCPNYVDSVDEGTVSLTVFATGFAHSRVTLDVRANNTTEQTVVLTAK